VTSGPEPGCRCDPAWPALVVHTEEGDVAVQPAATPGALACLYHVYCTGCGTDYPGPSGRSPQSAAAQESPGPSRGQGRSRRRGVPALPVCVHHCPPGSTSARRLQQLKSASASYGPNLADVINAAATRDQVTYVTSRSRRVAAVVSVAIGEQAGARKGS
jgi:prevent-host-death family protein